jgi:SPW repeat
MQLHHLRREPPGAQAVPGDGAASQAMPVPGPERDGFTAPGMAVQTCVMAGMLAGLWVAISPWFLSLQAYGGNATANDLIAGLAVATLAAFAVAGRGLLSLQAVGALALSRTGAAR